MSGVTPLVAFLVKALFDRSKRASSGYNFGLGHVGIICIFKVMVFFSFFRTGQANLCEWW